MGKELQYMKSPSIVFMGTPDFSVPSLQQLLANGYNVIGVVTQPDRPKGRKRQLTPPPVKVEALKHNIPVLQPEKLKQSFELNELLEWKPDLIVTAAFGQLLPKEVLQLPIHGCINVHASLLPKYRGGAPIHKAIIDGEKETGVTIMYMVEALDAGDILSQVKVPIELTDDVGTMHDKLSEAGATLLLDTIPKLLENAIEPTPQDESKVTYAWNIKREDEVVDWEKDALSIFNHVRGLRPFPVAYTTCEGQVIKLWGTQLLDDTNIKEVPGTVYELNDYGIKVATGDGKGLLITRLQPSGKKQMEAGDFIRGAGQSWTKGMRLGT